MDDKVKSIQARLRAALSQPLTLGHQLDDTPIVTFETLAGLPAGAETLVEDVIAELEGRGFRVAYIKRVNANSISEQESNTLASLMTNGTHASLLAADGCMVVAQRTDGVASLDDMIRVLGNDYDVIIGEAFGYLAVPKFLLSHRVHEAFNVGLPNVIGYISEKDVKASIPQFSPLDVEAIADKIQSYIIEPRNADRMRVVVNGSSIAISESKRALINETIARLSDDSDIADSIQSVHVMLSRKHDVVERDLQTS